MRRTSLVIPLALAALGACSGSNTSGFDNPAAGGGGSGADGGAGDNGGGDNGGGDNGGGHLGGPSDGGAPVSQGDATVTVTTTIYANTDDTLYSMDAKTHAVTVLGTFTGHEEADGGKPSVTDVAVNANGEVYVNTEKAVYRAALPPSGGQVHLTHVADIQTSASNRFYALAFTPADALGAGTGEVLIGGDINGELWSIDTASGATKDLGDFGADPDNTANFLSLSGDLVFYVDSSGAQKGLATIRSCAPGTNGGSPKCTKTDDVLAGVDMTALANAYTSGTAAKSLNGGMYGGSATTKGPGIGHGEVFGLGAWEGSVYGFSRHMTTPSTPAALYAIDPASGAGSNLPGTFTFTDGWSGAGVTTKVTVTVPPPPPPPPPPK